MNNWITVILVIIGVIFLFKVMGKGGGCCGGGHSNHKKDGENQEKKDGQHGGH